MLVGGCLFELKDADLKVRRWDASIDNIAVLVVAAVGIVKPVLVIQLQSCRSEVGQSKEKVDDFHFSFLFLLFFNVLLNESFDELSDLEGVFIVCRLYQSA